MISRDSARRTDANICFDGVDISKDIRKYMLSMTYTDNEEGEADDLQIKLEDRNNIWMCHWLNNLIEAAASPDVAPSYYRTTSAVNMRSGPGNSHSVLGTLAYGTQIAVSSLTNGWAVTTYSGKKAYIRADCLTKVVSGGSSDSWEIGDAVIASGRPQYTSYGEFTPGATVTNYSGNITYLNLKNGIPYPIHVGKLGWFSIEQVTKAGAVAAPASSASNKGLLIQASLCCENWTSAGTRRTLDCGQFELDCVDASGPPATITIKGTSLPYSAQIRQTKKSKAWESYTLSKIAAEIAKQGGMDCQYDSDTDPAYKRVEQVSQSDINFLSKLCKDAGISLKVSSNIIVLFDQAKYEAKPPIMNIKRGSGSYLKYKLSTGEADTQYSSCRVSYADPVTGISIEATAYIDDYDPESKNNQQLQVTAKVSSVGEAGALAKKRLRLHNKYEKNASFTFPGNPSLMASRTVSLSGWGLWNGKYIITQSVHSLGSSGYTTQITLRKVLEGY